MQSCEDLKSHQPRKLAYALAIVLCLLQAVVNGMASAQMQRAHENAGDNTMVICTGKGMVYINESVFLESGTMEFLTVDGSSITENFENGYINGMDTDIVSSCTVAAQSDNPTYAFELAQVNMLATTRSITNFTLSQNNYLRDTYLCALSRAPPITA